MTKQELHSIRKKELLTNQKLKTKFLPAPDIEISLGMIAQSERERLAAWILELMTQYSNASELDKADLSMYITEELLRVGHQSGWEEHEITVDEYAEYSPW